MPSNNDYTAIADALRSLGLPVELPAICSCIRYGFNTDEAVRFLADFYSNE